MSVFGIKWVLETGKKIWLKVGVDGATASLSCENHPEDFDERKMRMLATLEMAEDAERVDPCLPALKQKRMELIAIRACFERCMLNSPPSTNAVRPPNFSASCFGM